MRYLFAWSHKLAENADSAPVFATNVLFTHGQHENVLYVLAGNNTKDCDPNPSNVVKAATLDAFDAGTGHILWRRSTSGPGRCTTASPTVWGQGVSGPGLVGKVHKYDAATGSEYRNDGWPIVFTLDPFREKESAAL